MVKLKNPVHTNKEYLGLWYKLDNGTSLYWTSGTNDDRLICFKDNLVEIIPDCDKVTSGDEWMVKLQGKNGIVGGGQVEARHPEFVLLYGKKLHEKKSADWNNQINNGERLCLVEKQRLSENAKYKFVCQSNLYKLALKYKVENDLLKSENYPFYYRIRSFWYSYQNEKTYIQNIIILIFEALEKLILTFIRFQKDSGKYESGMINGGTVSDGAQGVLDQQQQSSVDSLHEFSKEARENAEKTSMRQVEQFNDIIQKLEEKNKELQKIKDHIDGKDEGKNDASGTGLSRKHPGGAVTSGGGTTEVYDVDTSGQDSEAKSRKHSDERH